MKVSTGLARLAVVALTLTPLLATGCVQPAGSGGTYATVYRSLVPYSGLGGQAQQIGNGRMYRETVGANPNGVFPVRDSAGKIVGVTAGCLSGNTDTGGTMSICLEGPNPGADFTFASGGTAVVTSQASAGAATIIDTTSEPNPVPTSGLSTNLFQTYVHTTCTTNAPYFPDGNCFGVSFTLQFGSSGAFL